MWEDELLKRNIAVTTGKTKTVDLPIVEDDEEDCIKIWHDVFTSSIIYGRSAGSYNPFPKGPPSYKELAKYGNDFWCRLRDGKFDIEADNFGDHLEILMSIQTEEKDIEFSIGVYLYADEDRDLIEFGIFDKSRNPIYENLQEGLLYDFYMKNKIVSKSDFASYILELYRIVKRGSSGSVTFPSNLYDKMKLITSWYDKRQQDYFMKSQITTTTGKTKTIDTPLVEDDEQDCIEEWLNFFKTLPVNVDITRSQMETYGEEYWCKLKESHLGYRASNQTEMEYAHFGIHIDKDSFLTSYYEHTPLALDWSFGFETVSLVIKEFNYEPPMRFDGFPSEKLTFVENFLIRSKENAEIQLQNIYNTYTKFMTFIRKNGGTVRIWQDNMWDEFIDSILSDFVTKSLVSRTKGKTKTVDLPIVEDDDEDCVQQWVDFMNDLLTEESVSREDLLKYGDNDFWCKMKTLEAVTFDAGWDKAKQETGIIGIKYTLDYSSYLFIGVKLDSIGLDESTFSTFIQLSVGGDRKPSYQVVSEKVPFKPNLKQYTEEGRKWYTSRLYKDGWLYEGWWKETAGIRKHPSSDFLEFINETMSFLHTNAKSFLTTQDKALEAELLFIIHWDEWIFEKNYEFNDERFIKSLVTTTTGKTKTVDQPLVEDDNSCREELAKIINEYFELGTKYIKTSKPNVTLIDLSEEDCCIILELIKTGGKHGYKTDRKGEVNKRNIIISSYAGGENILIRLYWAFTASIDFTDRPFYSTMGFEVVYIGDRASELRRRYAYSGPFDYTNIEYNINWRNSNVPPFVNLDNASKVWGKWISFSRNIHQFLKDLGWSPVTVMDDVADDVYDWVGFMGNNKYI